MTKKRSLEIDATAKFRQWRGDEFDRLLRLGCSRKFVEEFMAQWWRPIGPALDSRWVGVGTGESDED